MHLGSLELQIFVSMCVVLGIALIALIVDYLKAVNADLRESNVALRVRQEERRKTAPLRPRSAERAAPPVSNQIVFHVHGQGNVAAIPETSAAHFLPEPAPSLSTTPTAAEQLWPTPEDLLDAPEIPPARELRVAASDNPERIIAVTRIEQPAEEEPEPDLASDLFRLQSASILGTATEPICLALEPFPFQSSTTPAGAFAPVGDEHVPALDLSGLVDAAPAAATPQETEEVEPALVDCLLSLDFPVPPLPVAKTVESVETQDQDSEPPAMTDCLPLEVSIAAAPIERSETAQPLPTEAATLAFPDPRTLCDGAELSIQMESPVDSQAPGAVDPRPFIVVSRNAADPADVVPEPTLLAGAGLAVVQDLPVETRPVVEQVFAPQPLEPPTGMQSRETLQQLLNDSSRLMSGLVIAIGINDYESLQSSHSPAAHEELMRSVNEMLESILADKGFGARSKSDEFVLVFCGQGGAVGQRLLTQISERLWDFQLRSLTSMSILFSWGAVDVFSEPLSEALASANERMLQTKRTRLGSSQGNRRRAMAM